MLEYLQKKFAGYNDTCPITDLRPGCVTFIKDRSYIGHLRSAPKNIWVIAPTHHSNILSNFSFSTHYTGYPEYEFVLYHNYIHKYGVNKVPYVGENCNIHPSVIMDVDGLNYVAAPDGTRIKFRHTGRVSIGDNVDIGPYTVIHRGTMDKTVIGAGSKIGAQNNIGHNCQIGENNIIAVGVIFNGGVKTGKNCYFWSGSVIRNKVTICDDVVIGQGAVVTKDITEPGVYLGNPARYFSEG